MCRMVFIIKKWSNVSMLAWNIHPYLSHKKSMFWCFMYNIYPVDIFSITQKIGSVMILFQFVLLTYFPNSKYCISPNRVPHYIVPQHRSQSDKWEFCPGKWISKHSHGWSIGLTDGFSLFRGQNHVRQQHTKDVDRYTHELQRLCSVG